MLTKCPDCSTTFRVTPAQLKARAGKVRCGQCHFVFNALDTLDDDIANVVETTLSISSKAGHGAEYSSTALEASLLSEDAGTETDIDAIDIGEAEDIAAKTPAAESPDIVEAGSAPEITA